MDVELLIAGVTCAVLALGHATVGLRWVLPNLTKERLPSTPFGPPAMTLGMVRFTWHIVTLMLVAFAALLLSLAWTTAGDAETVLLRWLAALWVAATAMAVWNARRRPSNLLRLPVPFLMMVVAVLCWTASA
jgi:hypothetical protein